MPLTVYSTISITWINFLHTSCWHQ